MNKDKQRQEKKQESQERSSYLERECYRFLDRLLVVLNVSLDRRLVVTFFSLVIVIIMHRHRNQGLLLSELGGYLKPAYQAPAGTKRISNLLHAKGWSAEIIDEYLWLQAGERVEALQHVGKTVLMVWDESVLEKAESLKLEGLCAVISSKARRLKRIKKGYFNPPGGRPICVPGYHWLQVLFMGMEGPVTVAKMRWWTTRGEMATQLRTVEAKVMDEVTRAWGQKVIHVWDRGFAGAPWLSVAFAHNVRFIMRWPKRYQLLDTKDQESKAWEIVRGKRSWDHRLLWDARRRCQRKVGVFATPVFDKEHHHPLWLIVARSGSGREPWYSLTNEPILRKWETQLRLLLIATLAFAFLLSLLSLDDLVAWLLQTWCHRMGKWRLKVKTLLYRLRSALSPLVGLPSPLDR